MNSGPGSSRRLLWDKSLLELMNEASSAGVVSGSGVVGETVDGRIKATDKKGSPKSTENHKSESAGINKPLDVNNSQPHPAIAGCM